MSSSPLPAELLSLARWQVKDQSDRFGSAAKARMLAEGAGASRKAAYEIGTSVAELVSNAVKHGGGGRVEIALEAKARLALHVYVSDKGPGFPTIPKEPDVERWAHRSGGQGLGVGLDGVRRLMDEVHIDSRPEEGTTVIAIKRIG